MRRPPPIAERVDGLDWARITAELHERGVATTGPVLTTEECGKLAALYAGEDGFRSRIVMARHGFGRGEYKYFAYPLPALVASLRESVYPHLAPLANRWAELLGEDARFPGTLAAFLERCHAAGQLRPTPLLLQYEAGDYNCLHQDLYGDVAFPLQLAIVLSQPARDFEGGEFVVVEQRPRMQSRVEVVPLGQGEGVIFATSHRPQQGSRGHYRVTLRHGVSRLRAGRRHTLGIILHDGK